MAYDDKIANVHRARIWIRANQMSRRNINSFTRGRLVLENKADEEAEAKERMSDGGKKGKIYFEEGVPTLAPLVSQDQDDEELPGRVRSRLAKQAGISHGSLDKIEKILESENIPLIHECEQGKKTINAAFMEIQQGKKRFWKKCLSKYQNTLIMKY